MTVIAVRKYLKKIVLSADTQISWGGQKLVDSNKNLYNQWSKIWKTENMVVGMAGSVEGMTFFKIFTETRKPTSATVENIINYIVDFIGWVKKKNDNFKIENSNIIIIFEDKVY
jgi:ATP-dependent protease HslVU (ClpYQ) peptidase subunit